MLCGSWIVVRRDTGEAVLETYSQRVADAVNRERYDVLTAHDYLCALNERIRNEQVDAVS